MKSHRLRLLDLLLFEDFDDLLLLEVDVPPFLPFDPFEVSASSKSRNENYNFGNLQSWTKSVKNLQSFYPQDAHAVDFASQRTLTLPHLTMVKVVQLSAKMF